MEFLFDTLLDITSWHNGIVISLIEQTKSFETNTVYQRHTGHFARSCVHDAERFSGGSVGVGGFL